MRQDKIKLQKYHKVQFAHERKKDLKLFLAKSEDSIDTNIGFSSLGSSQIETARVSYSVGSKRSVSRPKRTAEFFASP